MVMIVTVIFVDHQIGHQGFSEIHLDLLLVHSLGNLVIV